MKKRCLIQGFFLFLLTFMINLASAQFYGGYGRFSITDFIDNIGPDNLVFIASFIVFFALLFYALGKFFKDSYGYPNKPVVGTIALAVSFIISYFGIYRSGFDLENFFYRVGVSFDLTPILLLIISLFVIWIIWFLGRRKEFGRTTFSLKRGLGGLFILLGALTIFLAALTDIFYEKTMAIIIGWVLIIIGFLLLKRRKKRTWEDDYPPSPRRQGIFGQTMKRRRELSDVKHEQKLDYIRQREEQKYQRKLHNEKARKRLKNIREVHNRKLAKEQIRQINNELTRLKQRIPNASSVIERGKIEDQIRAYGKKVKELRKFL